MSTYRMPTPKDYVDILAEAQGLVAQNYDRQEVAGSTVMVNQTVYFMLVPLRAGDVVTSVNIVIVTTAAAATTNAQVGLYDTAGNRLAQSANLGSAWETTGLKTNALSSAFTVPTTAGYYAALHCQASTLPILIRSSTLGGGVVSPIGSGVKGYGNQTAQSNLPASATIGTGAPIAFWVGIS